jgi:hypothetical protein
MAKYEYTFPVNRAVPPEGATLSLIFKEVNSYET